MGEIAEERELDLIFAALADPTRRAILTRLSLGDATVMELAEPFQISLPAVSKHLKVLTRAGLISRNREAQWLRCRLEPEALDEARGWIDRQREHWETSLSQLDDFLQQLQRADGDPMRDERTQQT